MSNVRITIDKNAQIHMHYEGFVGNECHIAESQIKQRIKNLRLTTTAEEEDKFEDRKLEIERG